MEILPLAQTTNGRTSPLHPLLHSHPHAVLFRVHQRVWPVFPSTHLCFFNSHQNNSVPLLPPVPYQFLDLGLYQSLQLHTLAELRILVFSFNLLLPCLEPSYDIHHSHSHTAQYRLNLCLFMSCSSIELNFHTFVIRNSGQCCHREHKRMQYHLSKGVLFLHFLTCDQSSDLVRPWPEYTSERRRVTSYQEFSVTVELAKDIRIPCDMGQKLYWRDVILAMCVFDGTDFKDGKYVDNGYPQA